MTRQEILDWLEANGKQKGGIREEVKEVDNPEYDRNKAGLSSYTVPPKIRVKTVSWETNTGKVLTVIDSTKGRAGDNPDAGTSGPAEQVDYEVIERGDKEQKDDTRPEDVKSKSIAQNAEAMWQRDNGPASLEPGAVHGPLFDGSGRGSGIYESHTERIQREAQAEGVARAGRTEERQGRTEERQSRTDERRTEIEGRRADTDAGRLAVEQGRAATEATLGAGRLEVDKDANTIRREQLEAEKGKQNVVGTPNYADEKITLINAKGEMTLQDNPNYDPVRKEAEKKREEIKLGIEAGRFTAEVGAQKYKEWYDANVTAPIAISQERRAQSTEKRQAQEAADRREQARRENELNRAKLGQDAAESAQANERAMLPFTAGPQFGEQFSSAITGLAHGGTLDSNAASGINFTADAFEFDRPNFARIAKQATKAALKHLTPYDPDETPYAVADYSGITQPTAETFANAPTGYTPSDTLMNNINSAVSNIPQYKPTP